MKVEIQSAFLKVNIDVKQGDIIRFVGEGEKVPDKWNKGKFKTNIQVSGDNFNDKLLTLNNSSLREMMKLYGDDTKNWIGKDAMINVVKQLVSGSMKDIIMLTAPNVDREGNVIIQ